MSKNQSYSPAFRTGAVKLVLEHRLSREAAAKQGFRRGPRSDCLLASVPVFIALPASSLAQSAIMTLSASRWSMAR